MAVAASIVLVVFLLLALAVPVGIWLLTERETSGQETVDRRTAEQTARSDRTDATDRRGGNW